MTTPLSIFIGLPYDILLQVQLVDLKEQQSSIIHNSSKFYNTNLKKNSKKLMR